MISLPAQARPAKGGVPKQSDFFDFERAVSFWQELKTGDAYDAEYAKCGSNAAYNRWDDYWLSPKLTSITDLTDDEDLELVKYCHDLNRTYDVWTDVYKNIVGWMDHGWNAQPPMGAPWNEWSGKVCDSRIYVHPWGADHGYHNKNIFTGECNDLPDWRVPSQVKEYDTLLANIAIRKGGKDEQSRRVISNYLETHGYTLSKEDRDALQTILGQLD